eukprot:CAMPEP_0194508822 /NCGR_PEP_ID=MMETSP0253-20130528/39134_1 /TAXON_ID=2966 /ORGANISM="Noctiluca scintillans" /LENGTH=180 /DNA_ID=CAMNT_0039351893 /DNA_START=416 /DNA_END=956 /DNA_ORIENTATION=-
MALVRLCHLALASATPVAEKRTDRRFCMHERGPPSSFSGDRQGNPDNPRNHKTVPALRAASWIAVPTAPGAPTASIQALGLAQESAIGILEPLVDVSGTLRCLPAQLHTEPVHGDGSAHVLGLLALSDLANLVGELRLAPRQLEDLLLQHVYAQAQGGDARLQGHVLGRREGRVREHVRQ